VPGAAARAVERDQDRQLLGARVGEPLREACSRIAVRLQDVPRDVVPDIADTERSEARVAEEEHVVVPDADQRVRRDGRPP
jgi:hypothetical protein